LLKWLLVERATLAGNIVRVQERACAVDRELETAQKRLTQLQNEVAQLQMYKMQLHQFLASKNERLSAMDTATGVAYNDQVAPDALGTIRAHAVEYEKRGNLKSFLASVLRDSAPTPLNTHILLDMTVEHFGLYFVAKAERATFKANTLKRTLYQLKKEGLVEAIPASTQTGAGQWRWKTSLPPLPELPLRAAA
jgi:DNA-binding transcriptional regulator YhcF (GntR family)